MNFARLLFYAVVTFFLGVIALASGGARALQLVLAPSAGSIFTPSSDEPFRTLLVWLTIVLTFVFLGLAVIVGLRRDDR